MWTLLKTFYQRVQKWRNPPQLGEVVFQHYVRSGFCNGCGQCCTGIHLVHGDQVIDSESWFEKLKKKFPDYRHFIPIEQDQVGLVFRCQHLQSDNSCGIHDRRPHFCRTFPSEAVMLIGGKLSDDCSYTFSPRYKFMDVLQKTKTQKRLWPGKLLNDVRLERLPRNQKAD